MESFTNTQINKEQRRKWLIRAIRRTDKRLSAIKKSNKMKKLTL
jgi:hypothetical protein